MMYKWVGAVLVIAACGVFGFSLVLCHKREERTLRELVSVLDFMECELQYRLTPLPDLCRQASRQINGILSDVFFRLAEELEAQIAPEVRACMGAVLAEYQELPKSSRQCLSQLGRSLGRFDLPGQVKGLDAVRSECRRTLEGLSHNRDTRLRSYQTLGICAGAALVILFI